MNDPTRDEMLAFLREAYAPYRDPHEDPAVEEFDIEEALYAFASDWHGGQSSNLYSALSTSPFRPGVNWNGCEPKTVAADLYAELEREYA